MKINVLSNAKGKILAALLPAKQDKQNRMVSCGPALRGGQTFSVVAVPKTAGEKDLSDLLARSSIKRSKGENVLVSRPAAVRATPYAKSAKKPASRKVKRR